MPVIDFPLENLCIIGIISGKSSQQLQTAAR